MAPLLCAAVSQSTGVFGIENDETHLALWVLFWTPEETLGEPPVSRPLNTHRVPCVPL